MHRAELNQALTRVSALGLACVVLLFVTGAYTSLIHLQNPERFVASPYGQTLLYKVLLVGVIVALAVYNRLWLLPASLKGNLTARFQRVMRLEALTLIAVFIVTGVLTTSALPHEPGVQPSALNNLTNLAALFRYILQRSLMMNILAKLTLILSLALSTLALAHETRTLEADNGTQYDVTVGLLNEPIYNTVRTGIDLIIRTTADEAPVENLESSLPSRHHLTGRLEHAHLDARAAVQQARLLHCRPLARRARHVRRTRVRLYRRDGSGRDVPA